jgi:uncharacterized membrane protein
MNSPAKRPAYLLRVGRAHKRLLIAALIGAATILVMPAALIIRLLVGWDIGVLIYLIGAAVVMAHCESVAQMESHAAAQDEGAFAVLVLTVAAAIASLGAIFAELAVIERSDSSYGLYVALAITTVVLSWAFTHTIFALHYAHDYYGGGSRGGLKFPEDDQPDYWDFVYFAFVIGMTFQVSDVAVTQKTIRRMVVAHGVVSFFFSAAIIAVMVNIAASIIQK